jgi:hypothetical protein
MRPGELGALPALSLLRTMVRLPLAMVRLLAPWRHKKRPPQFFETAACGGELFYIWIVPVCSFLLPPPKKKPILTPI